MATIRDVANKAKVSTATVSNVLNAHSGRVRPETRERVLAAIRDLRYRPTAREEKQATILTQNIGVMMTDLAKNPILRHDYFRNILDGILESAMFRGWSVTIFTEKMWGDHGLSIRRTYDGRCDGLILVASNEDHEVVHSLNERGVPIVLVGNSATLPGISSVDIDNESAGSLAATHLIALGHRRFGFVETTDSPTAGERERGFRRILCEAGFGGDDYRVYSPRGSGSVGRLVDEILSGKSRPPTAFFAWHDEAASALIEAFRSHGVCVPEDVSVVGVDGLVRINDSALQLTTVPQPFHSIGKRAASLLIDRLVDPTQPAEVVRFAVELRPGGTTCRPPQDLEPISLSDIAVLSS
ncbi:LacI family DNA-binding transcriptional regulator [Fimbriimonas ginsengisoli]|uniref:Transcriptional regulator n=1 Tax=Fimbriimonas ginsengisoli Gsoil 348 TaxID=661478 RepID=A0A068NYP4_FIMGI|nr:LacI family DNA-binding transcriptional regulator [Fimbriimonas ginsengisoli]AIE87179.1 Transcriptional regulator [Fimbriimonas ginsengisoli Gsoil 348]